MRRSVRSYHRANVLSARSSGSRACPQPVPSRLHWILDILRSRLSCRGRLGLTSSISALDAFDLFFRYGPSGRDVAHPGGSHVVKFRCQTSKPAASSAPPHRATAPRKTSHILTCLHTRVKRFHNYQPSKKLKQLNEKLSPKFHSARRLLY